MNTAMSWIKAYVPDLDVTPQEYTDAMTLIGTKVEGCLLYTSLPWMDLIKFSAIIPDAMIFSRRWNWKSMRLSLM